MNLQKLQWKILTGLLTVFMIFGTGALSMTAQAAGGNIYTCTIVPSYSHPVTGVIEDSGGEASSVTGQGMVTGAVGSVGMLEVTDDGSYYLTFRLGLMDYTSNQSFLVQTIGESSWHTPAMGITGTGTDSNGTTADVCVQVPGESCIVRGSMYVTPMGRDVIFYLYPKDYTAGNTSGMNATMVTEASGSSQTASDSSAGGADSSGTDSSANEADSSGTDSSADTGDAASGDGGSANAETQSAPGDENAADTAETSSGTVSSSDIPVSSLETSAAAVSGESAVPSTDTSLQSSQGLSLSTEPKAAATDSASPNGGGMTGGTLFLALTAALTVSGLILLGAAAGLVYYFRKNWYRWGGEDYEDED